jgi:hypothetical protein
MRHMHACTRVMIPPSLVVLHTCIICVRTQQKTIFVRDDDVNRLPDWYIRTNLLGERESI